MEGGLLDCRSDIYSFGRVLDRIFPHGYSNVKRHCCRKERSQRYANAKQLKASLFGFRHWCSVIAPILLILILICSAYYIKFDYTSPTPFLKTIDSGQTLRFKIDHSEAIIIGAANASGDMVIPSYIRHHLVRYPITTIDSAAFHSCRELQHLVAPRMFWVKSKVGIFDMRVGAAFGYALAFFNSAAAIVVLIEYVL